MEQSLALFRQHLQACGLKLTRQRRLILRVFLSFDHAVTTEELFTEVQGHDTGISLSTVYRMAKLLRSSGLAHCRKYNDGATRFEPLTGHNLYLVCERCGMETVRRNPYLDSIHRTAAEQAHFNFRHCRTVLHGLCPDCMNKE